MTILSLQHVRQRWLVCLFLLPWRHRLINPHSIHNLICVTLFQSWVGFFCSVEGSCFGRNEADLSFIGSYIRNIWDMETRTLFDLIHWPSLKCVCNVCIVFACWYYLHKYIASFFLINILVHQATSRHEDSGHINMTWCVLWHPSLIIFFPM